MRRLALIFLLLYSQGASAEHYRLVSLVFPPMEYVNEKGEPDGAAVEIVRTVMGKLGHSVTIEILPWSRSMNLVKEGKADGIFTCYRNPEREKFLDFSNGVLIPQIVSLYVKKGSSHGYKGDLRELKGRSIGTLNTVSYGQIFDEAKEKIPLTTHRVEVLDLNFKKLLAGRLDYVVSNRYSAEVVLRDMRLEKEIVELPTPVEVIPSYIAFSKQRKLTALRDAFDIELRKLKGSGVYYEILKKYDVRVPAIFAKND